MSGGIPSGSNPAGWEAATGSNPAQGYDPTSIPGSVVGSGSTAGQIPSIPSGLSGMVQRTEDAVRAAYSELVQNNSTFKGYSDQLFAGLNPDGTTPISTLIIQALGAAFGIPQAQLTSTEASLAAIESAFTALGGNITTANNNFNTLLTDMSQSTAAALATFLNNVATNASGAAQDWQTLLTTLEQADSAAFAAYISATNANAQSAYNNWTTLFEDAGIGASTAATFASWLTGVNTTATSANSTANTAQTNATSALAQWTSMITAAGQATATAVGNMLSTAAANIQTGWNDLVSAFTGTTVTGQTSANVKTAAAAVTSTANTASSNASTALTNASSASSAASAAQSSATSALTSISQMLTAASQGNATAFGAALSSLGTNLQNTWNDLVTAFTGTSSTGQTASNVQTAAASVTSTANTASTNASTAISNASTAQTTANTASTNASSALTQWTNALTAAGAATATALGTALSTAATNIQTTWNDLVTAFTGTSSTGQTAANVQTAAAATASTANTASTNASSALSQFTSMITAAGQATASAVGTALATAASNIQTEWNNLVSAFTGTTVTGQTAAQVKTAAAGLTSTANTASTNASTAISNASAAQGTANTASTNASSALSQFTSLLTAAGQATAAAVGTALSNAVTNIQTGWDDLWQGLTGSSGTGHSASDVKTAAAATTSTANTASTNASTALSNASAAQGTANTASTNASSALSQWTSAIAAAGAASASALGTLLSNAGANIQSTWDDLVSAFTGSSSTGNTASGVQTAAAATASTANTANTNAANAGTNIATLINAIPQNLQGATGTQTQAQAAAALAATAQTQAYLSAQVSALMAQQSAGSTGGTSISFSFMANTPATGQGLASTSSNVTSVFDFVNVQGSLNWELVANVGLQPDYVSGSQGESFLMCKTPSQTDYQLFSTVFNQNGTGASYFIFRANSPSNPTAYGICAITPIYAQIFWINGASQTQIGSQQFFSLSSGTPIQFLAGESGNTRSFALLQNGNPIATWSDGSSQTTVGASNRYGGLGCAITSSLTGFASSYFGFADNTPPPIKGSKLRVGSLATTFTCTSNPGKFGSGFYNSILEQSADIAYNTATGIATVSVAGQYMVKVKFCLAAGLGNQYIGTALYHAASGGTPALYDLDDYQEVYNGSLQQGQRSSVYFVNCQAGDQIQAGYQSGFLSSGAILGDSAGAGMKATFEIMLCNTSTNG